MTIEGKEFTIRGAQDFVIEPGRSGWSFIDRKIINVTCDESDEGGHVRIQDGSINIFSKDEGHIPLVHEVQIPKNSSVSVNIDDRLRLEVKHVIKGENK